MLPHALPSLTPPTLSGLVVTLEVSEHICSASSRCSDALLLIGKSLERRLGQHVEFPRNSIGVEWPTSWQPRIKRARHAAEEAVERHGSRIAATLVGVALFGLLGGRALSFSPSNVRNLGAFARSKASLPATLEYATPAGYTQMLSLVANQMANQKYVSVFP